MTEITFNDVITYDKISSTITGKEDVVNTVIDGMYQMVWDAFYTVSKYYARKKGAGEDAVWASVVGMASTMLKPDADMFSNGVLGHQVVHPDGTRESVAGMSLTTAVRKWLRTDWNADPLPSREVNGYELGEPDDRRLQAKSGIEVQRLAEKRLSEICPVKVVNGQIVEDEQALKVISEYLDVVLDARDAELYSAPEGEFNSVIDDPVRKAIEEKYRESTVTTYKQQKVNVTPKWYKSLGFDAPCADAYEALPSRFAPVSIPHIVRAIRNGGGHVRAWVRKDETMDLTAIARATSSTSNDHAYMLSWAARDQAKREDFAEMTMSWKVTGNENPVAAYLKPEYGLNRDKVDSIVSRLKPSVDCLTSVEDVLGMIRSEMVSPVEIVEIFRGLAKAMSDEKVEDTYLDCIDELAELGVIDLDDDDIQFQVMRHETAGEWLKPYKPGMSMKLAMSVMRSMIGSAVEYGDPNCSTWSDETARREMFTTLVYSGGRFEEIASAIIRTLTKEGHYKGLYKRHGVVQVSNVEIKGVQNGRSFWTWSELVRDSRWISHDNPEWLGAQIDQRIEQVKSMREKVVNDPKRLASANMFLAAMESTRARVRVTEDWRSR